MFAGKFTFLEAMLAHSGKAGIAGSLKILGRGLDSSASLLEKSHKAARHFSKPLKISGKFLSDKSETAGQKFFESWMAISETFRYITRTGGKYSEKLVRSIAGEKLSPVNIKRFNYFGRVLTGLSFPGGTTFAGILLSILDFEEESFDKLLENDPALVEALVWTAGNENPEKILQDLKNSENKTMQQFIQNLKIRLAQTDFRNFLNKSGNNYVFAESSPNLIKDTAGESEVEVLFDMPETDSKYSIIYTTMDNPLEGAVTVPIQESSLDKRIYQIFKIF